MATEDEHGNAQHLSFIIWILVILFYFPPKANIEKYQSKLMLD